MMLSGVSQRGSKRTVLGSGSLQHNRRFTFLPNAYRYRYGLIRIIRNQRKGLPENPLKQLFPRSRKDKDSQQQPILYWGRKWECEERNGVTKETNSEYVPGKGWVSIRSAHSGAREGKVFDNTKNSNEEFDIDLITLHRIPRETAAGKSTQKPDVVQENLEKLVSENLSEVEQRHNRESTADANRESLPAESLPANEEGSGAPPSSDNRKLAKEKAKKTPVKNNSVFSEPTSVPNEPSHKSSKAAEQANKEKVPTDALKDSPLASTVGAGVAEQAVPPDNLPAGFPELLKATSNGLSPKKAAEACREGRASVQDEENFAPQSVKPEKKARAISPQDKTTSKPKDSRGVLGEILAKQKQVFEKMALPQLPSKTVISSEVAVADVLGTLKKSIKALDSVREINQPVPTQTEKRKVDLDSTTSSDASVKTVKKSSGSSSKSIELNLKADKPATGGLENSKKATKEVPLPILTSEKTNNMNGEFAASGSVVSVAEPVSKPVPPIPRESLDENTRIFVKSQASSPAQAFKKRVPLSSPTSTESNTQASVAPSGLTASQPMPPKSAKSILDGPSIVAKSETAEATKGPFRNTSASNAVEPSDVIVDAVVPASNSAVSTKPKTGIRKGSPVPSFFANDSVTDILEEVRGASAPLASGSLAKETFKYHKLNIVNRPGEDLGSPDADVDILLPSDIRAAAGAPGKKITKLETEAEKQRRRKKMVGEFEVSYERERSEAFGIGVDVGENSSKILRAVNADKPVKEIHDLAESSKRLEGNVALRLENGAMVLKERGVKRVEESEDYSWSGTEDVSAEDVLGVTQSPTNLRTPLLATSSVTQQEVFRTGDTSAQASLPVVHKFFALIRNPENGNIQFTALPQQIVNDAMTREDTAFDSLQNLDSPESFLPLWRVLQKGGFTVVAGEKDCLVVKVEAEIAKAKQELVLKEIKQKLSPAEVLARASWERRRADKLGAGKEFDTTDIDKTGGIAAPIESQPRSAVVREMAVPSISKSGPESKSEPELMVAQQTVEETVRTERKPVEQISGAQAKKSGKNRPFRRVFWAAVWVAACSGAVSVGLEAYL